MREEQKLNKALQRDGFNTQSDILDNLKRRYPNYVEQSATKHRPNKRRHVAVICSLAAIAASVAIIVPCAILLSPKGDGGNNVVSSDRYCSRGEYSEEACEYSLREYSATCGGAILYFDWYSASEDIITTRYVGNDDKEILCVEEFAYLVEYDEMIYLSVTKSNVYLGMFDSAIEKCDSEQSVDNHIVKWNLNEDEVVGIFEDKGYRYFIRILQGQDENRLFELVAELLETK